MSSGSGKTTITCGLIKALKNRGLKVSARKCGPDYIDTMFLRTALSVPTGNLDPYFTDGEMMRYLLSSGCGDSDITVIEGEKRYPARAVDIDSRGRLIIETPEGRTRLNYGEVSLRLK